MSTSFAALGPVMLDVAGTALTDDDRTRLSHPLVGGVILFTRNYQSPQQVTELIADIKALRTPSLIVAVDQEGGRVQRFRDGFTQLPPAAELGRLWDADPHTAPMRAFEISYRMASELRAVDVDFSFAPVLDITSRASDVIGDRCFHHDPAAAIDLQGAFIDGMHAAGMVAIGKHFPGHGGVAGDSHTCLPEDPRSLEELQALDLLPYQQLINELQGIMTAHILYPQCDADVATHSSFWIQQMLREALQFGGVVFSDDLSMAGALAAGQLDSATVLDSAQKALAAGCDTLLLCNQPELADALLADLASQTQPMSASAQAGLHTLRGR